MTTTPQQMLQKLDAASAAVAEAEARQAHRHRRRREEWQASAQQALAATEEFKNLQVRLAQASSLRVGSRTASSARCGSVEHAPAQIAERAVG